MRKYSIPHDTIDFFENRQPRIFEIVAPLYQNGLSITEIAKQTGLKRTAIWQSLRSKRDELIGVIMALSAFHNIDTIQRAVWIAQARLIYESRTETWGSQHFLRQKGAE